MLADENTQVIPWGSRAIELAEKLGATETLVHALNNVGTAQMLGQNAQGRVKLEESLRLALANNLQDHVSRAYTNLAFITVRHREYQPALRYLEDGIAYATEHDLDFYKLYMTTIRARALFEQGDWERAADDAGYVLARYRVSAITKIPALAVLGHVRVRRGDPDAARLLDEANQLAMQTAELQRIAPVASARAELAWFMGTWRPTVWPQRWLTPSIRWSPTLRSAPGMTEPGSRTRTSVRAHSARPTRLLTARAPT